MINPLAQNILEQTIKFEEVVQVKTKVTELMNIKHPIIQAPMAGGITTTKLVSAVSNAGGLGMIGAGYMSPAQLREQIREIKKQTSNLFGVNLFVPGVYSVDNKEIDETNQLLAPIRQLLSIPTPDPHSCADHVKVFDEQIQVIFEEEVAICSFTFGLPSASVIDELKRKHIQLIGTATSVQEAISCERAGMDAIVVQGSEAGGHRGTFTDNYEGSLIGLMSLIPQVRDQVQVPIIAAGGIMDGRGLLASIHLGADAVQMGTAFLTTIESGAHPIHKKAILVASEEETVVTRSFSGKPARGLKNRYIEELQPFEKELPDFPMLNTLTQDIRKAASNQENADFMSLWSGQSPRLAKEESVEEVINSTIAQAEAILKNSLNLV
jgi:nitronate monooxygenase